MSHLCTSQGTLYLSLSLANFLLLAGATPGHAQAEKPKTLRIGVVASIFQDIPSSEAKAFLIPLNSLIQTQTGLPCHSDMIKDVWELGKALKSREIDMGVLTGFEYAWIQENYPNLKPLAIPVVCKHPRPVASLVVNQKSSITDFAGLAKKKVSLPRGSRPEVCLFLKRAQDKEKGFQVCRQQPNVEDALDGVVNGKVAAAVVDDVSLDAYRALKPGCFKKLKIVQQSPTFPAAVVVYREGVLDQNTLAQFKAGLLGAHRDPRNRTLMSLFQLSSFDAVPSDYQQALVNIRKSFPAPEKTQ